MLVFQDCGNPSFSKTKKNCNKRSLDFWLVWMLVWQAADGGRRQKRLGGRRRWEARKKSDGPQEEICVGRQTQVRLGDHTQIRKSQWCENISRQTSCSRTLNLFDFKTVFKHSAAYFPTFWSTQSVSGNIWMWLDQIIKTN